MVSSPIVRSQRPVGSVGALRRDIRSPRLRGDDRPVGSVGALRRDIRSPRLRGTDRPVGSVGALRRQLRRPRSRGGDRPGRLGSRQDTVGSRGPGGLGPAVDSRRPRRPRCRRRGRRGRRRGGGEGGEGLGGQGEVPDLARLLPAGLTAPQQVPEGVPHLLGREPSIHEAPQHFPAHMLLPVRAIASRHTMLAHGVFFLPRPAVNSRVRAARQRLVVLLMLVGLYPSRWASSGGS